MRFEFKLPDLAEGMVEGEIVAWHVAPGDEVKAEQPMVEVMTDKATVVISSPREGRVLEVGHAAGDIAPVGSLLFVLDVEGEGGEPAAAAPPAHASGPAPERPRAEAPPAPMGTPAAPRQAAGAPAAEPDPARGGVPRGAGRVLATPATRRLARELGVDIAAVTPSGPGGRVTKDDVRRAVQALPTSGVPSPPEPAPAPRVALEPLLARRPEAEEGEERVRLRGLRRAIYETMRRSTATAAHFTYVEEVECTNLVAARRRLKGVAEEGGVRLTFLPFIAKAALLALRAFPRMNAAMDDEAGEIVLKRHRHLGIAAATEAGLIVPVVRHADHLTLLELAARVQDLGERARSGRLTLEETRGSTFTITSLGKIGGVLATPIINHPEVAILGVHKLEDRAVVRDGQIVARPMMNISLSFDHRVVDGHEGAAFAQRVRLYLEDPERMLLEMA